MTATPRTNDADVLILGAGLAGLTLALDLLRRAPGLRVTLVERRGFPAPVAAHKVGESTVEVGAHYLGHHLGLEDLLRSAQLPKFGLRFFFSAGGNQRLEDRPEIGPRATPPVPSYQIDRGTFETALAERVLAAGATLLEHTRVTEVRPSDRLGDPHVAVVQGPEGERALTARWLIDAAGRGGLLRRTLGLDRPTRHAAHAAWFRVEGDVDVDAWTADARFHGECTSPLGRRFSTNHLMGPGYWTWVIPLPTGATSIGIVRDGHLHERHTIDRRERAYAWLEANEPQCHRELQGRAVLDFHVLDGYSHGASRWLSGAGWAAVGDAGVFLDPLYSPGSDFVGTANRLVADLIVRDHAGEAIAARAEAFEAFYLRIFRAWLGLYARKGALYGDAALMGAKICWDFAAYWSLLGTLHLHDLVEDLDAQAALAEPLARIHHVHARVQQAFLDELGNAHQAPTYLDYTTVPWVRATYDAMTPKKSPEAALEHVRAMVPVFEERAEAWLRTRDVAALTT